MIEISTVAKNQTYVLFPISSNAKETAKDVNVFQKMTLATGAQKHYADNSVSFTCDFSPEKEGEFVEEILSEFLPQTKVISMFPQFEGTTVQFKHLPFEEKSWEDFMRRLFAEGGLSSAVLTCVRVDSLWLQSPL